MPPVARTSRRGAPSTPKFHQKFILRDYHERRATSPGNPALLSGSANFTWTDTHVNLNNVFVFRNSYVCRQYEIEFKQLAGSEFGRARHGESPKTYDLAGVPGDVPLCPDHTLELEIMKQMPKGASEIVSAIFTFSGYSGIDDTLVALARGGMTIRGVLDREQAAHDWAAPKK